MQPLASVHASTGIDHSSHTLYYKHSSHWYHQQYNRHVHHTHCGTSLLLERSILHGKNINQCIRNNCNSTLLYLLPRDIHALESTQESHRRNSQPLHIPFEGCVMLRHCTFHTKKTEVSEPVTWSGLSNALIGLLPWSWHKLQWHIPEKQNYWTKCHLDRFGAFLQAAAFQTCFSLLFCSVLFCSKF